MIKYSSVSLLYSSCIKTKIHKPKRNPTNLAAPEEKRGFGKKSIHTFHTISFYIWNLPSRTVIKATQLFAVNPKQWKIAIPPFSFKWNIPDHQRKAYPAFLLFLNFNISSFLYKSLLTIFGLCTVNDYILPIQFTTALSPLLHSLPFFLFPTPFSHV